MQYSDSDSLRSLSAYIRPQIGLPFEGCKTPIDAALANFAVTRHRVGPLLYKAAKQDQNVDELTGAILASSYQQNVRAVLAQRAVLQKLTALFETHAIPFSVLKGLGIADQIYDDPQTRQSKDIDILIPPEAAPAAIQLLTSNGYIYQPHSLRAKPSTRLKRQLSDMKLFKDLIFLDPQFSVVIELHQRLFKIEPENFTAGFNDAIQFQKTPSVLDSHYCFYLIVHGAVSLWQLLKWLIDLSLLARNMPVPERQKLMTLAKSYDCDTLVSASLRLVEEIFSGSLDQEWNTILDEQKQDQDVQVLTDIFGQSLMTTSASDPGLTARRPFYFYSYAVVFGRQIGIFKILWHRVLLQIAMRT